MKRFAALAVGAALLLSGSGPLLAQRKKKDEPAPATPPPAAPAKKVEPIKDKLKTARAYPGLLQMHQDTVTGALYMVLKKSQVGKEYIYWSYIENSPTQLPGGGKGSFRGNGIFSIEKYFDRIDFVRQNTSYHFDPNNPISRAKDANLSNAILASSKIVASDTATGELLIEANGVFLSEALTQLKFPSPPGAPPSFGPGQFSASKSRVVKVRNYPANTDVVLDYVYENPVPWFGANGEIADPRAMTVRIQHSLIEVPQNDYVARRADPRVGYFMEYIDDQTTIKSANYVDLINRWHLKKKDPSAAMSEPVEPIVYWIENTTPREFRPLIKEAAERWNIAFEKAGFKNALVVKEQPDNADWDAGDIRYNVLRWMATPNPQYGGYGPSFTNPRTGQILGADIMLEWTFMVNRINSANVFDPTTAIEHPEHATHGGHPRHLTCSAGHHLQLSNMTGFALLETADEADVYSPSRDQISTGELSKLVPASRAQLVRDGLFYLIIHEIGHTLGLEHNMKSSNLLSPTELNNITQTEKSGQVGSIMEYPAINYALTRAQQGNYYSTTPGPYDLWAIEFGYSPELDDAAKRATHLARSTEPKHIYGNDADDMRSPGGGIDPRVNIYDLSTDPVGYSKHMMDIARTALPKLSSRLVKPGDWYQDLWTAYNVLQGQYGVQAYVTACHVGGVYVNRSVSGQPGAQPTYTPVPAEQQKRAMKLLADYVFAPTGYATDASLYTMAARERRGFNFFGTGEDLRLHNQALAMHRRVLSHLLHPATTRRITDTRLYGNAYSLSEMMNDLTGAVFSADLAGTVNTIRQNLQTEYVNGLIAASGLGKTLSPAAAAYDHITRREAFTQLKRIDGMLATAPGTGDTQKHRAYLRFLIDTALDD